MRHLKTVKWLGIGGIIMGLLAGAIFSSQAEAPTKPTAPKNQTIPGAIRYLPLGDSYTIGESVAADMRWPNQLVKIIAGDNIVLKIVDNPSVTGYTSQDLIDKELPQVSKLNPDFVSVQIGVNDYIKGVNEQTFNKNLNHILDTVQQGIPQPGNIVLVTIPDYAKTPTGSTYGDPSIASKGIGVFNQIITQVGAERGLPVADIFVISQGVVNDSALNASDELHPSGMQYGLWANEIYKTIKASGLLK